MKPLLILALTLIYSTAFSQISLELTGGVGFDINKFNTQYTITRKPLSHAYGANTVQFTILEPRSVGINLWWEFAKKLDLSIGLQSRYSNRNITGVMNDGNENKFYDFMGGIAVRRLLIGGVIKKEFTLNEKSSLFVQIGLLSAHSMDGNNSAWSNVGKRYGDFAARSTELVKYKSDEEYYNLIIVVSQYISPKVSTFTQGYTMQITPKLDLSLSSSIFFEFTDRTHIGGANKFVIYGWNSITQATAFGYTPTSLKFSSIMVDLSLKYEF